MSVQPVGLGQTVKAENMLRIFSMAAPEILVRLNPDSITNFSLACRSFRCLANNEDLWRALLERDFGKDAVSSASGADEMGKYKRAYIKIFLGVKKSLKELSQTEALLKETCSNKENVVALLELASSKNFSQFLRKLPVKELERLFCMSVELGVIPLAQAIMNSEGFNKVSINDTPFCLGHAFIFSIEQKQVAALRLIINSGKFKYICTPGTYGLITAFSKARRNKLAEVAEFIKARINESIDSDRS